MELLSVKEHIGLLSAREGENIRVNLGIHLFHPSEWGTPRGAATAVWPHSSGNHESVVKMLHPRCWAAAQIRKSTADPATPRLRQQLFIMDGGAPFCRAGSCRVRRGAAFLFCSRRWDQPGRYQRRREFSSAGVCETHSLSAVVTAFPLGLVTSGAPRCLNQSIVQCKIRGHV